MSDPTLASRGEVAHVLRLIAADLRSAGDVPLVHLSAEGVTRSAITLADELWLLALRTDGRMKSEGPDE